MAIQINVEKVLASAERRKLDPAPELQIKLGGKSVACKRPESHGINKVVEAIEDATLKAMDPVLRSLWDQMTVVKKERAKLSTRASHLVDEIEVRLRKEEGPAVADDFLLGNVPMPELVQHYGQIQSLTDEAITLYDKIKYVEKYGKLPGEQPAGAVVQMDAPDVSILQLELNRLKDLIHKTKKKITVGKAKNPLRIQEWHEKLALAEARREDVRLKIKKLQYNARG